MVEDEKQDDKTGYVGMARYIILCIYVWDVFRAAVSYGFTINGN